MQIPQFKWPMNKCGSFAQSERESEKKSPSTRAICTLFENVWISLIRYFHYRHLYILKTRSLSRPGPFTIRKSFFFRSPVVVVVRTIVRSSRAHSNSFRCPRKWQRIKRCDSISMKMQLCRLGMSSLAHLMWWRGEHTKEHSRRS